MNIQGPAPTREPTTNSNQPWRKLSGQDWCDDDDDDEHEEEEEDEEGDGGDDKAGPHATLQSHGPAVSAGSADHPNDCMPCTFYCFTKRGCNRGKDCRFCHLAHQSKLQQRREAWKKQQREKRKSIRERARKEASMQKASIVIKDSPPTMMQQSHALPPTRRGQASPNANNMLVDGGMGKAGMNNKERDFTLSYRPTDNALLVVGQEVFLEPSLENVAANYRLKVPLPHGLLLDQSSGIIHGVPTVAAARRTIIVEADVPNVGTTRGSVEFEVVDITGKDFAIGHLSEVEPGQFVMIVHQPEELQGANRLRQTRAHASRGNMKGKAVLQPEEMGMSMPMPMFMQQCL